MNARPISGTAIALIAVAATARAQDATVVYRLGRDTVAIEQITRTSSHLTGESLLRQGTALTRSQYDVTLSGGKPTGLVFRRRQARWLADSEQPDRMALHLRR